MFLFGIINIPCFSSAENEIGLQSSEINVEINPENPGPHEDVIVNISSYATDLNKAIISWQVPSVDEASGIGKTSYKIKTGAIDIPITINISIKPVGSMDTITKKIVIIPSEIEIMWESVDGYAPPFYKGKKLPISGGTIKAVAIPNTGYIKSGSGSITYTWANNGSVIDTASGYNKNYYLFKNSLFDEVNNISVMASSVSGDYSAEKTVEIPLYKPKIIFYEKSPTEGTLYNKAISDNTYITNDEMTIVAEPYFLSLKDNNDKFTYTWKINDKDIATPINKTELTIRPTSRGGYATVGLTIENMTELFQKISNSIKLEL